MTVSKAVARRRKVTAEEMLITCWVYALGGFVVVMALGAASSTPLETWSGIAAAVSGAFACIGIICYIAMRFGLMTEADLK